MEHGSIHSGNWYILLLRFNVCKFSMQNMIFHSRWPPRYDQWWECKFLAEGIIDQGGGFRDSLSDLSDELCPSAADVPVPLPFFIRSPNQVNTGPLV